MGEFFKSKIKTYHKSKSGGWEDVLRAGIHKIKTPVDQVGKRIGHDNFLDIFVH
jgi:hypothetical protein